jgi:hypothetical protein
VKKVLGKHPLERQRERWVDSINMDRKLMTPAQHQTYCAGKVHQQFSGNDGKQNTI